MNLLRWLLRKHMAWVLPRPRLVLALAAVSAVACMVFTYLRLDVNTDQLELISPNHPLISIIERQSPFNFGGKTTFTVVVETPSQDRGIAFLKSLMDRVDRDKVHFLGAHYRIDPEVLDGWALLYLDQPELAALRDRLRENPEMLASVARSPDLDGFLAGINRQMASRVVGELFTGFLDDDPKTEGDKGGEAPLNLGVLLETLNGVRNSVVAPPGSEVSATTYESPLEKLFVTGSSNLSREGYFWEGDKKLLLAFVFPKKTGSGLEETSGPLEKLRDYIAETRREFPEVNAGVTGEEALNNDEMRTAADDMSVATWLSMAGVLGLTILFFRGARRPLMGLAYLGVAISWTFGWTTLFIGRLNILSVVFAPLLCGIGDDYGIHLFSRHEEENAENGSDRREVIRRAMERSGPGIVLAALSTALSFLPYVLTGFRGLMELGLITGVGILLSLLSGLTVLPALLVVFGIDGKQRRAKVRARRRDVLSFSRRSAVLVLAACGLLTVLSIFSAVRVHFDINPLNLQARTAESVIWEKRLVEGNKGALFTAGVLAESMTTLTAKLKALKSLPTVSSAECILDYLPENQDAKLPIVKEIGALVPALNPTASAKPPNRDDLIDSLERIRFKMQSDLADGSGADRALVDQMNRVRDLCDEILRVLRQGDGVPHGLVAYNAAFSKDLARAWHLLSQASAVTRMEIPDLPEVLRNRFVHGGDYLIRVYPREGVWQENALKTFVESVRSVDPDVGGDPVSLFVFASSFRAACVSASIYAVLFIVALLLVTFRDLRLTLVAMLPLAVGTLWGLGIMGVADVDFNLANSMFIPLVVGAGVEYGIIILNRWKEGTMSPGTLPFSTGKGVTLAALTTNLAFGSLMISDHRGIFSLDFVAWAGSLCVLIAALVITTAILAFMKPPAVEAPRSLDR